MRTSGRRSLKKRPTPVIVPPVPTEMTIASTSPPSVCSQISGAVVTKCASGFDGFEYWSGLNPPGISSASRSETM